MLLCPLSFSPHLRFPPVADIFSRYFGLDRHLVSSSGRRSSFSSSEDDGESFASRLARFGERAREAARTFGQRAEPLVRLGASQLRRAVDERLAPAAAAAGAAAASAASAGVDALAGAVLGQERKREAFRSVGETLGALGTIARAVVSTEEEEDGGQQSAAEDASSGYYDGYDLQTSASDSYFQYQSLNPAVYYPRHNHHPNSLTPYNPVPRFRNPQYPNPNPIHPYPHKQQEHEFSSPRHFNNYHQQQQQQQQRGPVFGPSFPDLNTLLSSSSPNNNRGSEGQSVEEAFYVLGKNLLGENVTDRLLPVAKRVAVGLGQVGKGLGTITQAASPITSQSTKLSHPAVEFGSDGLRVKTVPQQQQQQQQQPSSISDAGGDRARGERNAEVGSSSSSSQVKQGAGVVDPDAPRCTTPGGGQGRCTDIQNCPLLLADLSMLRRSICFKTFFVPGVCCADNGYGI